MSDTPTPVAEAIVVDAQNPYRYIESVQFDSERLNGHHSYIK